MNVTINGKDAYATWGIVFDSSAISSLMTPPAMKSYVENESRAEHGKRVITDTSLAKVDSRQVSLSFALTAKNENDFFAKYSNFCNEISNTGKIDIKLSGDFTVGYKLIYKSCTQFTEYNQKMAKFVLKCEEPNPKDRTV